MSVQVPAFDRDAERAVLGGLLLLSDHRHVSGLCARGLRPEHFYYEGYGQVFRAAVSLADRAAAVDPITLAGEMDRLGTRGDITRGQIEDLVADVPSSGNYRAYADIVVEKARWRDRQRAVYDLQQAVEKQDVVRYSRAQAALDSAVAGTRTESFSPEQWAALLFDYYSASKEEVAEFAIPLPFARLNQALGGGLAPGESMAVSGPTSHGKSTFADMCLDHAADRGKRCHLYMTEMTAIQRGLRYMARRTGVPYLRQRRRTELDDRERKMILSELSRMRYGCSIVADWTIDDIVRDALRARYDLVVIDLIHGFHVEDAAALDRLSKAVQRLARVSTTLDGHRGTAVMALTHLKEEGIVKGRVPKPSISSIKGGSSVKQDCDFVAFIWQEQPEDGPPTGEGEIWIAKGRSGEPAKVRVALNPTRFRFELRDDADTPPPPAGSQERKKEDMPF